MSAVVAAVAGVPGPGVSLSVPGAGFAAVLGLIATAAGVAHSAARRAAQR
ncbi:hypothetical protein [Streptomonospora alba]|nr:hypothetical protein [Streptomonospora alba]